ncbi:hypothetical protein MUP01_00160 [Candidatus Bathyarchaeota archaeon]|nr:hypothetical protein [Candidatus Bathyarchaeota archaeon]
MKKKELATLSLLLIIIGAVTAYVVIKNPFAPAGTWQVASQISGTGNQDTTEFTMNSQWCLAWRIDNRTANLFIVEVYARNSSGFSRVAETDESDTNATQGEFPVDFTGSFVIRVVAASDTSWSLRILELVKPA